MSGSALAQGTAATAFEDWDFLRGTAERIPLESCIASTRSVRTELFFALRPTDEGEIRHTVLVRNENWDVTERDVDFDIWFGPSEWNFYGKGNGSDVYSIWTEDVPRGDLIEAIAAHRSAVLKAEDGRELDSFSLAGSRGAMTAVETCIRDMSGREFDVPGGGIDPFSGHDPF